MIECVRLPRYQNKNLGEKSTKKRQAQENVDTAFKFFKMIAMLKTFWQTAGFNEWTVPSMKLCRERSAIASNTDAQLKELFDAYTANISDTGRVLAVKDNADFKSRCPVICSKLHLTDWRWRIKKKFPHTPQCNATENPATDTTMASRCEVACEYVIKCISEHASDGSGGQEWERCLRHKNRDGLSAVKSVVLIRHGESTWSSLLV